MTIRAEEGNYYWSNGYAYGTIAVKKQGDKFNANISVEAGTLELNKLVFLDGINLEVNSIKLEDENVILEGKRILLN